MSVPRVDVVVVTYRSGAHLTECLSALPSVRSVTVVENASGDDASAIARQAGATVIENATNRGFGAAANQGLHVGSAPYVRSPAHGWCRASPGRAERSARIACREHAHHNSVSLSEIAPSRATLSEMPG